MSDKLFYLTSRHGNCGSNVMFHNKNGAGYGTNLDKLHLFTLEESQKELGHDIKSLPLLKSEVDKVAIRAIDHQYLREDPKDDPNGEYCIQVKREYNGNDIAFVVMGGITFNYSEAHVFTGRDASLFKNSKHTIWPKTYLDGLSRRTFQEENISTRKMITGAGIKYKKPRPSKATGKVRWNCPSCGKISWQFNPYDFDGCLDYECDEYNPNIDKLWCPED